MCAFVQMERSARRRSRIWGTWTPTISARFPARPLGRGLEALPRGVLRGEAVLLVRAVAERLVAAAAAAAEPDALPVRHVDLLAGGIDDGERTNRFVGTVRVDDQRVCHMARTIAGPRVTR